MSVREKINSHPVWAAVMTVIIVSGIVYVMLQMSGVGVAAKLSNRAFFTTDDSSPAAAKAALFADSADNLPPFQKNGKTAYLACVFSCDGGKTTWVGYLLRYTPQGLEQIRAATTNTNPSQGLAKFKIGMQGTQVKRPGDGQWTDFNNSSRSVSITDVRCPDGSRDNIMMVNP